MGRIGVTTEYVPYPVLTTKIDIYKLTRSW